MPSNRKHIIEELEALSPILAKLKTSENIDDLPQDYFSTLSSDVLEAIEVRDQAKDVPTAYFQNLTNHLLNKIDTLPIANSKPTIDLQKYRLRERPNISGYFARVGVAAIVLIGLFMSIRNAYFSKLEVAQPCENDLACLEKEDLYNYVEHATVITADEIINPNTTVTKDTTSATSTIQDITAAEAIEILTAEQEDALTDETLDIF